MSVGAGEGTTPYFNMLFKGCFTDDEKKKCCFTPDTIEIDGRRRGATLVLDVSEMYEKKRPDRPRRDQSVLVLQTDGERRLADCPGRLGLRQ